MSQTKPEHPPEATPTTESATGGLDREWQREQRKRRGQYETKRVKPGPVDSARVKAYKKQADEAARKVMELLLDGDRVLDVFRERILFAVGAYKDYERQRKKEYLREKTQRALDVAAAWRDRRLRDKHAGPPSEKHVWRDHDSTYSNKPRTRDIEALQRAGSNVTLKEFHYAWNRKQWGFWQTRPMQARADISPAPWLQKILDGERSDDESELLPLYYGILAAIHDKHPDHPPMITKSVWPEYLLDHVWRLLDPLHGLPVTTIQRAVKAVEEDLAATIETQPTTGEKPGPSLTGEKMSDADRIKRFAPFFLGIARQADKLLEMEPNRAFLRKKVEEFFRLVAESEDDGVKSLDAREECERFIQDQERPGDYVIRYTGGGTDAHGPHEWAVHKILADGSEEECFKGPEISRHVNPLDWFPPQAAWWSNESGDATGNDALLRDCALITLIHDDHYAHHQPLAFFGADTPAWPGSFDWPETFYSNLRGFFWIPDADSPDVGRLRAFIEKALECVRAALADRIAPVSYFSFPFLCKGPEPQAGGEGSGQSGTPNGGEVQPKGQDHDWCILAVTKKELGLAFGLPDDKHIADALGKLLKSTGMVLRSETAKSHRIAIDTIPRAYFERFAEYMKTYHHVSIKSPMPADD